MRHICDAPDGNAWFRLETESEADWESVRMRHGLAERFRLERARAVRSYRTGPAPFSGRAITLERHIRIEMPIFLSLRGRHDEPLVTVMLAHANREHRDAEFVVVGKGNSDPYPAHGRAIDALADKLGIDLGRARCFPSACTAPEQRSAVRQDG